MVMFHRRKVSQQEFEDKIKKIVAINVEIAKNDMELVMERSSNKLQKQITKLEDENKELKIEIAKLSIDIHHKNLQIGVLLTSFVGYMAYTSYVR